MKVSADPRKFSTQTRHRMMTGTDLRFLSGYPNDMKDIWRLLESFSYVRLESSARVLPLPITNYYLSGYPDKTRNVKWIETNSHTA
jgi:hypothetical protein